METVVNGALNVDVRWDCTSSISVGISHILIVNANARLLRMIRLSVRAGGGAVKVLLEALAGKRVPVSAWSFAIMGVALPEVADIEAPVSDVLWILSVVLIISHRRSEGVASVRS